MKTLFTAMFALAMPALMIASNGDDQVTYKVNTEASNIKWNGYKVTGEHEGTINIMNGMIAMDNGKLVGGEFTIDMSSLTVTDLTGETKGKLEGHLKSDDFFGVATYPNAMLKITKVKEKSDGYHITGDLTIKEKTHPIEFVAVVSQEGEQMIARTRITVDRSKYDVRYGSNSFFDNLGDKAIYDNFDLSVELVFSEEAS
jgi:polyisoprenoid-binding protein YceI